MYATLPEKRFYVDREAIRKYAAITRDNNPIHLDPAFAESTAMRGIIAHGTLSLSLIWQSLSDAHWPTCRDVIRLDVRFLRPVREGDVVIAGGALKDPSGVYDVWVRVESATRNEIVISGTAMITSDAASSPIHV
jgi:3-hydroxybutyryl-CoA dehydratase